MIFLIVVLIILLTSYLVICAKKWGVPEMISDTYYQGAGAWFSAVMAAEAIGFLVATLHTSHSTLHAAGGVLGCIGLLLVGVVPMYKHCRKHLFVHKVAAYVAAIGCIGWCLVVNPLPTIYVAILYAAHMIASGKKKSWYVAEISAFICIFVTLFIQYL